MPTLASTDFARLLDVTPKELGEAAGNILHSCNFSYRVADPCERERILLQILKRIDSDAFSVSGAYRKEEWEKGWNENLQAFVNSGFKLETLIPKYFKPDQPRRLNGEFIYPEDPNFELNFIRAVRSWLAERYLSSFEHIFEFGCGTGYHLVDLAANCPDSTIHAFDWVDASARTFALLGERFHLKIDAGVFNFFEPDNALEVPANSVCFTFAALEQAGKDYERFLEFILKKQFALCVHVECMDEFYSPDVLQDYLAIRYHRQRNYLNGFHGAVSRLEQAQKAQILKSRRTTAGNMFHEAYSILIWKPC